MLPLGSTEAVPQLDDQKLMLPLGSNKIVPQLDDQKLMLPLAGSNKIVPQLDDQTLMLPQGSTGAVPQLDDQMLMLPLGSTGTVPQRDDHHWPPHLDEMAPPLHIFDLTGASHIMKYWHVGGSRPDEWLVLYPEHKVSFIRRTKQLGIDLL